MKTFKYLLMIIGISMLSSAGIINNTLAHEEIQTLAGNDNNSRGAKDKEGTVLVCHRTNGKTAFFELWVPVSAVPAHLAHGDKIRHCGLDIPT